MGLLTKAIRNQKIPFDMTAVRIRSLDDGRETFVRLIDPQYSTNGEIVETVELPSFDGEYATAYSTIYSSYLNLSLKLDGYLRAGMLFN